MYEEHMLIVSTQCEHFRGKSLGYVGRHTDETALVKAVIAPPFQTGHHKQAAYNGQRAAQVVCREYKIHTTCVEVDGLRHSDGLHAPKVTSQNTEGCFAARLIGNMGFDPEVRGNDLFF